MRKVLRCFRETARVGADVTPRGRLLQTSETTSCDREGTVADHGGKRWFLKLLGFQFLKNLERSIFLVFMVFWILVFRINFALKPCGYYFLIIILFSIYVNLHSLQRLPPNFTSVLLYFILCTSCSRVFRQFFNFIYENLKNHKTIKKPLKIKKYFKNHWVFHPCRRRW